MAGPIRIAILANGKQARTEATLTARAYSGMGRTIARSGAALGIGGLVAGTVGLAKASISTEAQFSQAMNLIAANIPVTGAELQKLNDLAIKLGADTVFSASEAADAMLELAKGGFKQAEIAGGGVQATMALAATEGLELANAATIVGNAMNSFGLEAKDANQIADALAAGSAASSASVQSLSEGLGNVGASAKQSGMSLQDTVTALTLLDANAIKGAEGGTALRSFLTALTPTSVKAKNKIAELGLEFSNADGSFRSLGDISEQLRSKLGKLGEAQRAEALQTIFGSYAKQAASIFLDQGARGFSKYSREVNKSGTAQKLADARMKGTSGAVERLSGAVETAQLRIGQELAPTVQKVADYLGDNLEPAVEAVIDGVKDFAAAVEPAFSAAIDLLEDLVPSGDAAASMFDDKLIPAVSTLADATADVLGFIDDLPGWVKESGIQAGIAALIFPRLAAGAMAAGTAMRNASTYAQVLALEMRDSNTRGAMLRTELGRLGPAARTAAGIGGMVALAQSTSSADREMTFLLSTLGGAASGFSIGGPIGALIGGAGGGLLGLYQATRQSNDEFSDAPRILTDYAASLDEVTGAINRQVHQQAAKALRDAGALPLAREMGISTRDLVKASLGHEKALSRVNTVFQEQLNTSRPALDAYGNIVQRTGLMSDEAYRLAQILGVETEALAASQTEVRELGIANGELARSMEGIRGATRERIVSRIETRGWPESERQIARVVRGLNLTPKQVRTVVQALGTGESVAGVQRVLRQMEAADKKRARPKVEVETKGAARDVSGWVQTFTRSLTGAEGAARRGGGNVRKGLEEGPRNAKADLSTLLGGVRSGTARAASEGASGGSNAGAALGAGLYSGMNAWAGTIANRAASIVREAVAAARRAGNIQSPSRETAYLGQMLGEGLAVGIALTRGRNRAAGRDAVRETLAGVAEMAGIYGRGGKGKDPIGKALRGMLAGVTGGSAGVEQSLNKVSSYVEKTYDRNLKAEKRAIAASLREREKELRKRLKGRELDKALSKARKAADKRERDAERANAKASKAGIKSLRDERAALAANGKAQDRLASGNYLGSLTKGSRLWVQMTRLGVKNLGEAVEKHRELVEQSNQYAAGIKQAFVEYGSITALGEGDGYGSSDQFLAQLRAREVRANQYADMIERLRKAGLSKVNIDDLLSKGVEGGFGTAQMLLNGGQSVIRETNALTASIAKTGAGLGAQLAKTYYGAGIQSAAGLVAGLKAKEKELDRVAQRLANQMVKAVKKALGIKSPSRVFRGIGDDTVRGLAIGLDDTYVRRQGARLAGSLEAGFGSPALSTYAAAAAATAASSLDAITFRLQLTSEQTTDLQMGKMLMGKIDVARGDGVKWAAV